MKKKKKKKATKVKSKKLTVSWKKLTVKLNYIGYLKTEQITPMSRETAGSVSCKYISKSWEDVFNSETGNGRNRYKDSDESKDQWS